MTTAIKSRRKRQPVADSELFMYHILHPQVVAIANSTDIRTITKRLEDANVPIRAFGKQKVVLRADLLNAVVSQDDTTIDEVGYEPKNSTNKVT